MDAMDNTTTNVFETSTYGAGRNFDSADHMIQWSRDKGVWPIATKKADVHVENVRATGHSAILATYADGTKAVRGINSGKYQHTTVPQWEELCRAAGQLGLRASFAHSIGNKVAAQFEVETNGISTYLTLADSFDGSTHLLAGMTATDMVCANQLMSLVRRKRSTDWARIRHSASLTEKVNRLRTGMGIALEEGATLRSLLEDANHTLAPDGLFDVLFPKAADDASERAKTRAANNREEAVIAAGLPCNSRNGATIGNLWAAATYLVDRKATGEQRGCRGGASVVGSMLFGTRAKRVEEVRHLVEVVMADGTLQHVEASEAVEFGVDSKVLGATLLEDMLS